jgi:hypothetical protein
MKVIATAKIIAARTRPFDLLAVVVVLMPLTMLSLVTRPVGRVQSPVGQCGDHESDDCGRDPDSHAVPERVV